MNPFMVGLLAGVLTAGPIGFLAAALLAANHRDPEPECCLCPPHAQLDATLRKGT